MSNIYFFYLPYIYVFAWKTKLITNTKSVEGKFKKKTKKNSKVTTVTKFLFRNSDKIKLVEFADINTHDVSQNGGTVGDSKQYSPLFILSINNKK